MVFFWVHGTQEHTHERYGSAVWLPVPRQHLRTVALGRQA